MKKIIKLIILCTLAFILGFAAFSFAYDQGYKSGLDNTELLSNYACHDGCSIATKGEDGFLTDNTWDCWEECNNYIGEIFKK